MSPRFAAGDAVAVRLAFPSGHVRTPVYVRGRRGVIERVCGEFRNPESLAYGGDGLPKRTLYRVRFGQAELWPDYAGSAEDHVEVEIYEHWLEPAGPVREDRR
jgi:Nitrile hydratase beta subunit, C-terminal